MANDLKLNLEREILKKNIFVISRFYSSVSLKKIALLLENDVNLVEDLLCELINDKLINAKIDRLSG